MYRVQNKILDILNQPVFTGMEIRENAEMAAYTTYRVGGPADFLVLPDQVEQLLELIKRLREGEIPFFVLGEGSNLLVSDTGIRGVVISLKKCTAVLTLKSRNEIQAGAGVLLLEVVKFAEQHDITGIASLAGIPGTVGGALVMNAGAFGSEIGDFVSKIEVINEHNELQVLLPEQVRFGYRSAPGFEGKIIISVIINGAYEAGAAVNLENQRDEYVNRREQKQPLNYGSCGSVFKRPQNNFAGALIEQAGCKGMKIGEAMVSPKHANFIVNLGGATASDIYRLIQQIKKRVYDNSGIKLETEVKFIGDFPQLT